MPRGRRRTRSTSAEVTPHGRPHGLPRGHEKGEEAEGLLTTVPSARNESMLRRSSHLVP
jgi:hypothetical protein